MHSCTCWKSPKYRNDTAMASIVRKIRTDTVQITNSFATHMLYSGKADA